MLAALFLNLGGPAPPAPVVKGAREHWGNWWWGRELKRWATRRETERTVDEPIVVEPIVVEFVAPDAPKITPEPAPVYDPGAVYEKIRARIAQAVYKDMEFVRTETLKARYRAQIEEEIRQREQEEDLIAIINLLD
ncbi:MAG: hypothetical protein ACRD2L_04540 [Terriglobia bacterium]